jgi:hypothetical protein
MTKQFELEQRIMQCWGVVEDIEHFIVAQDNLNMTEDDRANYLLGLKTIYQVKFENLFGCFEEYIREVHHDNKAPQVTL